MRNLIQGFIVFSMMPLLVAVADDGRPTVSDEKLNGQFDYELIFDSDFSKPTTLDPNVGLWRREDMGVSNNAGQHRQAEGRRHAAWYDRFADKTAFVADGVLVQRGFIADSDLPGFTSRDSAASPRNISYSDPDARDAAGGIINFADFELHTSWLDTFALKSVKGKQVPVLRSDKRLPKKEFWGQDGAADTSSPNIIFSPGTFFEIEVNFEGMQALGHRHSFWLMPAGGQNLAYDNDPANGLEVDIYEHELAIEKDAAVGPQGQRRNEILLMKSIGGKTTPASTRNEIRDDGNTAIHSPGINKGWHKIGLLWTRDSLLWFVDGKTVVRDQKLVPRVPMFLILSREANTGANKDGSSESLQADGDKIPYDAGLFGRNVAAVANRKLIKSGKDDVRVRYVRAWRISGR